MKPYLLSFIVLLLTVTFTTTHAQAPTLWGLNYGGGANDGGTIFNLNTTTNQPVAQYSFMATDTDGYHPDGTMMEATDGYFYGTTNRGGKEDVGTIFRYDVTTNTEKLLHSFTEGNMNDGTDPGASLIQVNSNTLYGVTQNGGSYDEGTIFSFNISTGQEKVEYEFAGGASDAGKPWGALLQVNDSLLYGLSQENGGLSRGVIYKYNMVLGVESVVYSFGNDTDGHYSTSGLIKASDGLLYGMTFGGGKNSAGTIFSFNPATRVETVVYSFAGSPGGFSPFDSFIQVGDSDLYATTYGGGKHTVGTLFKYNIYSHITTQLYDFGNGTDGNYPYYGPLFLAGNNLLYGMTQEGGAYGEGIIFIYNIALDSEMDVYDFSPGVDSCGIQPMGGFVAYNTVTTGINQLAANDGGQLTVYPNPSTGQFTLKVSDNEKGSLIEVYNVVGENVYQSVANNSSTIINLDAQPSGIYFVYLKSAQGLIVKKVMVGK